MTISTTSHNKETLINFRKLLLVVLKFFASTYIFTLALSTFGTTSVVSKHEEYY